MALFAEVALETLGGTHSLSLGSSFTWKKSDESRYWHHWLTATLATPETTVTLAGASVLSRFSFDSPLSPRELWVNVLTLIKVLLTIVCCLCQGHLDSSSLSLSDFFSFLAFFLDLDLQAGNQLPNWCSRQKFVQNWIFCQIANLFNSTTCFYFDSASPSSPFSPSRLGHVRDPWDIKSIFHKIYPLLK